MSEAKLEQHLTSPILQSTLTGSMVPSSGSRPRIRVTYKGIVPDRLSVGASCIAGSCTSQELYQLPHDVDCLSGLIARLLSPNVVETHHVVVTIDGFQVAANQTLDVFRENDEVQVELIKQNSTDKAKDRKKRQKKSEKKKKKQKKEDHKHVKLNSATEKKKKKKKDGGEIIEKMCKPSMNKLQKRRAVEVTKKAKKSKREKIDRSLEKKTTTPGDTKNNLCQLQTEAASVCKEKRTPSITQGSKASAKSQRRKLRRQRQKKQRSLDPSSDNKTRNVTTELEGSSTLLGASAQIIQKVPSSPRTHDGKRVVNITGTSGKKDGLLPHPQLVHSHLQQEMKGRSSHQTATKSNSKSPAWARSPTSPEAISEVNKIIQWVQNKPDGHNESARGVELTNRTAGDYQYGAHGRGRGRQPVKEHSKTINVHHEKHGNDHQLSSSHPSQKIDSQPEVGRNEQSSNSESSQSHAQWQSSEEYVKAAAVNVFRPDEYGYKRPYEVIASISKKEKETQSVSNAKKIALPPDANLHIGDVVLYQTVSQDQQTFVPNLSSVKQGKVKFCDKERIIFDTDGIKRETEVSRIGLANVRILSGPTFNMIQRGDHKLSQLILPGDVSPEQKLSVNASAVSGAKCEGRECNTKTSLHLSEIQEAQAMAFFARCDEAVPRRKRRLSAMRRKRGKKFNHRVDGTAEGAKSRNEYSQRSSARVTGSVANSTTEFLSLIAAQRHRVGLHK